MSKTITIEQARLAAAFLLEPLTTSEEAIEQAAERLVAAVKDGRDPDELVTIVRFARMFNSVAASSKPMRYDDGLSLVGQPRRSHTPT